MKKKLIEGIISNLRSFSGRFDEIRIFGKGYYGTLIYKYLKQYDIGVSGFVISDEHYTKGETDTIALSELRNLIDKGKNIGIVIALSENHYYEVFYNLKTAEIEKTRCYLISGSEKIAIREYEKMCGEQGVARSISSYEEFFLNVCNCNILGRLNLVCHQHLGDTCILLGLKCEIEKHYKKEMNYIVKETQSCIPQMYGITTYKTVDFDNLFRNDLTKGFSEEELESYRSDIREKLFSNLPQTQVPFVTTPFRWNDRWDSEWKTVVNSRARMLGMDTTMINPPSGSIEPSEHLREFVEKEGGWDKVVLVAPEARANPQIPIEYWENILKKLKKEGFNVICNAMRKENRLEGTVDLNLSVSDLIALGQRCHEIHSTRSGLCDCLAARGSSLHVYYTNNLDREFEYYSLNNNFYLNDPVTEVIVDD